MTDLLDTRKTLKPPIGLAISGGVDSMVLAYMLIECGHSPILLHINYKKRGLESDKDEQLVEAFAKKHGLAFFCKRMDETPKGNFQAWARDVRYAWFEEMRKVHGINTMLTAHHLDDHYETILFRLMRGASLSSLQGIPKKHGHWVRPLLNVSKQEILDYATEKNIPWRQDQSNFEDTFDRNYIRLHVIPQLDKNYPDWREKMGDVAVLAQYYNETIQERINICVVDGNLNRELWLNHPQNIKKSILNRWLLASFGVTVSKSFLQQIEHIEKLHTGKAIVVNDSYSILRDRAWFRLVENKAAFEPISIIISEAQLGESFKECASGIFFKRGMWAGKPQKQVLELDAGKIVFPVKLRTWQAGDRIIPLGMSGSKLVSDVLTDARIPAVQKNEAFVLESFDGSINAVIFPCKFDQRSGIISRDVRCTETTTYTLTISHYNS